MLSREARRGQASTAHEGEPRQAVDLHAVGVELPQWLSPCSTQRTVGATRGVALPGHVRVAGSQQSQQSPNRFTQVRLFF
jgi:hypothetical protein